MKLALAMVISMFTVSAFAQKYDGDLTEMYLSWCDAEQNVVRSGDNNTLLILQSCASEQKVCVLDQRTSGKKVYYSASCQDAPVKYGRD